MKEYLKKYKLYLLLLFITFIIGLSYAYWVITHVQSTSNIADTGCFNITYSDKNNINITNAYAMSDKKGLTETPYSFTITNTCKIDALYQINLETLNTSTFNKSYLKVALNSSNINLLGNLVATSTTIDNAVSSNILTINSLSASSSITYNLNIWPDKDTPQSEGENKSYEGKISVTLSAIKLLSSTLLDSYGGKAKVEEKTAPDFSEAATLVKSYSDNGFGNPDFHFDVENMYAVSYVSYSDSYTFDTATANYSLVNPQICKYSECYNSLINKYIFDTYTWQDNNTTPDTNARNTINRVKNATYDSTAGTGTIIANFNNEPIKNYDIDEFNTGMWSALDDYGTSYYFRGDVNNNSILFAGFCWKIIRINGDGSIRLLYRGISSDGQCSNLSASLRIAVVKFNDYTTADNAYVGYMYGTAGSDNYEATHANINDSTVKKAVDAWYETNLASYSDKLSDTLFCNNRKLIGNYGYGTYSSSYGDYSSSFKCPNQHDRFTVNDTIIGNGDLKYPIGLMTRNELIAAGSESYNYSLDYTNYLSDMSFWTMSPYKSTEEYSLQGSSIWESTINNISGVSPVINLKSTTQFIQGDGSLTNPYIVN